MPVEGSPRTSVEAPRKHACFRYYGRVSRVPPIAALGLAVLFLACVAPGPSDVEPLKADARRAVAGGNIDSALRMLQRATAAAPNDAEAFFLLGALELRAGHAEDAEAALARAVELDSRDPRVLSAHGLSLKAVERYPEAERALLHSLALRPGDAATLASLGDVYRRWGKPEKCASRYAQFVELLEQREIAAPQAAAHHGRALEAARERMHECDSASQPTAGPDVPVEDAADASEDVDAPPASAAR